VSKDCSCAHGSASVKESSYVLNCKQPLKSRKPRAWFYGENWSGNFARISSAMNESSHRILSNRDADSRGSARPFHKGRS
jgi:hypothetical protein